MSKEFQTSGAKFKVVHCPPKRSTNVCFISAIPVKRCFMDTHSIRRPHYYFMDSLLCPWEKKALAFSLNNFSVCINGEGLTV